MFLKARATKHYRSLPLHSQDPISNSPYFLLNCHGLSWELRSYTMNSEKRNTSYHTKTKKKKNSHAEGETVIKSLLDIKLSSK